ncbi:MAG: HNH endonuclease [Pirellulales bacterium]
MRREVFRRANGRCEYCLVHEDDSAARHQVDHVVAIKHGGATDLRNLALCCLPCNRRKASDIGTIDPRSQQFVRLFNPRTQAWVDHFGIAGNEFVGRTTCGRATAEFLQFNSPERLLERASLIAAGRLP